MRRTNLAAKERERKNMFKLHLSKYKERKREREREGKRERRKEREREREENRRRSRVKQHNPQQQPAAKRDSTAAQRPSGLATARREHLARLEGTWRGPSRRLARARVGRHRASSWRPRRPGRRHLRRAG